MLQEDCIPVFCLTNNDHGMSNSRVQGCQGSALRFMHGVIPCCCMHAAYPLVPQSLGNTPCQCHSMRFNPAIKSSGLTAGGVAGDPGRAEPVLAWFDRVLADVGDGQSLQQSLSTFSGHVRRVRNIMAHATRRSLVLMDEASRSLSSLHAPVNHPKLPIVFCQ